MQTDDTHTWGGNVFHETIAEPHVATLRNDRQTGALVVSIGDVDLPSFVSDGRLYIQAPLPLVFKAFAEDISDFISDMEIRVSDARGRTLSLDRYGRPVSGAGVAQSRVVRSGGKR
jgi:hypothetical protein